MKNSIKKLAVLLFCVGSTFISSQGVTATSKVPSDEQEEIQISKDPFSNITVEAGKSQITSTPPGRFSLMVYNNFQRDGEFILYNSQYVSLYNKKNGAVSYGVAPQVIRSTHRDGQWFLINTAYGPQWIYNDDDIVTLRDVDVKNSNLVVKENVFVHSEPFHTYNTYEIIAPTTFHVLKQAGSWYLVKYDNRQFWICTENAKYENTIESFDTTSIFGIPYKKMIIPAGNESVRPKYPFKPGYITVHNTANTAAGADALMHANYLLNEAETNPETWKSWHFTVDDKQIIQHLPLDEAGFHAGDDGGPGNRSSIGIEIAENTDGNYAKAEENAKKLISYLIEQLDIPMENLRKHEDWSGKHCPRVVLDQGGWLEFKTELQQIHDSNNPDNAVYRIITGGIVGEDKVKNELKRIQTETGWWATYELQYGVTVPFYRIISGEFAGSEAAINAMNSIKAQTGWWMTYERTRPAYSIYRVVTGGFVGEENVKLALEAIKRDTGWWATYEKTSQPNIYRIVTGGFGGELAAKNALDKVTARGWWATYENHGEPVYYYRVRTGEMLEENVVKQALLHFTDRGWAASYEPSGNFEKVFQIRTGGFKKELAEQNAQWLTETRGWWVTTQKIM